MITLSWTKLGIGFSDCSVRGDGLVFAVGSTAETKGYLMVWNGATWIKDKFLDAKKIVVDNRNNMLVLTVKGSILLYSAGAPSWKDITYG